MGDLYDTRALWIANKANLMHHILGLTLVGCAMAVVPDEADHAIAPFLLVELSTLFLNAMWLLRTFGHGDTPAASLATYAFAASFFVTRVVGMPLYMRYLQV